LYSRVSANICIILVFDCCITSPLYYHQCDNVEDCWILGYAFVCWSEC